MRHQSLKTCGLFVLITTMAFAAQSQAKDPLPSWNDAAAKKTIVSFVEKTTAKDSADFVPTAERIAVFDNDGTLWSEQPMYFQAIFIFDRIKELAPQHPEWTSKEPFASVLKGDVNAALAGGEHALLEMTMATHAGMTIEEFEKSVTHLVSTARHPTTGRLYTEMVFQPMLEVLIYLRANGYKTFIVSGGGIDFMRPWAERVYGIPPEQVNEFVSALRAAGVDNDVHIYDEVNHGFWLRIDGNPELRTEPGLDAWQRLISYLDRTLSD